MHRREFLAASGAIPASGIAGCLGLGGPPDVDLYPHEVEAGSWPSFRYDEVNTGHNPSVENARGSPEEPAWRYETGDAIWGSPVVVDGVLYIGSYDTHLYALSAETGEERWRYPTDDRIDGTPAVVDGTVYFGSFDETVYALDAETGQEQWRFRTGGIVRSSPTVVGDVVYVGSHCNKNECAEFYDEDFPEIGYVFALDRETGEQIWEYEIADEVLSTPAYSDGTLYVGSADHGLYSLDARTGDANWVANTHDWIQSSPAVVGDGVYVTSRDGNVYKIDAETREFQWVFETDTYMFPASPTVSGDTVYVGQEEDHEEGISIFYAIDRDTGEERWSRQIPGQVLGSSAALADDRLFFGTHNYFENFPGDPGLFCLDTDGNERWRLTTEDDLFAGDIGIGSSPAVTTVSSSTRLYVGNSDGFVYCFDVTG